MSVQELAKKEKQKKIIHVDMDCFYAAVEILERPELQNKPVIIGGSPESRSVVCTANYPARKFGIKSAMPCFKAYQLCPQAVFIQPCFKKYQEASQNIRSIFLRYTDKIEPLSLDEAFLDVTNNPLNLYAAQIAKRIKNEIQDELKLSCSIGVSSNKMLAKIASDWLKPSGIMLVLPEKAADFMKNLALRKIPGVGPISERKLRNLGLKTCLDIQKKSKNEIIDLLGFRFGSWIYERSFGRDTRELETNRKRKSIGHEDTFPYDLIEKEDISTALEKIIHSLIQNMERKNFYGRTLTLKLTYYDFKKITRSITISQSFRSFSIIKNLALSLLEKTEAGTKKIRLLGLAISSLENKEERENSLFND